MLLAWLMAIQPAPDANPFRKMAERFVNGNDVWQDSAFQHAFDGYWTCWRAAVRSSPGQGDTQRVDAAHAACADKLRDGTERADARVAAFRPDQSIPERQSITRTYRRTLAVLKYREVAQPHGVGRDAYNQFVDRAFPLDQ